MDIAPPSGGDTHLETAVKIANQIVVQKVGGRWQLMSTLSLCAVMWS